MPASKLPRNESIEGPSIAPVNFRSQIVSGSLILLAGSGLVGVANLVYNILVARLLGPNGFGEAAAVYTLLMLMSAVTLSFQIVCAKLVANHESPAEKAAIYVGLQRRAWRYGLVIGLVMVFARGIIANYLNLHDSTLIVLLGAGTAFYIPLGVRRGWFQGVYDFRRLAINLILEGLVRLGGALVLIRMGMGVTGAVLASVAAVILAYLFAAPGRQLNVVEGVEIRASFREGLQAIVFFAGQVVINNFDIVLVKHFFVSEEAGLYAAVALVGRLVNMFAWSVVNTMLPVSAGAGSEESEGRPVLMTSLLLVFLILAFVILGLWMIPSFLWKMVFGAQFELAAYGSISSLLILYALSTGIYSLGSVIIAYEMSRKIANTGWLQLAFSGLLVGGIYLLHGNLRQVILVQLALMLVLLAVLLLSLLRSQAHNPRTTVLSPLGTIRKLRALSEAEVIAEFLKSEFHHPEFIEYRERFAYLIDHPDLANSDQNLLRRSLLFLRRGPMWRELPSDTKWFEIELTEADLQRTRFFPRAQWRRIAQGSFYLTDVVARLRAEATNHSDDDFFCKLRLLSAGEEDINATVLLIGVDESKPLTILDGNHRIAAAMLAGQMPLQHRFRFVCGFSPRMTDCCWYQTNMNSLWRYARHLLRYKLYDPEGFGRLSPDGS